MRQGNKLRSGWFFRVIVTVSFAFALLCCGPAAPAAQSTASDPLPSWNDGLAKQRLIKFVNEVTNTALPGFVNRADRIATFDNDGTLWVEKPSYNQVFFTIARIRELAPNHPEWTTKQPFKAVLEGDLGALAKLSKADVFSLLGATHAGMTQDHFETMAKAFLRTAKHPRFKVPFQDVVYKPMIELIRYLQKNGFEVHICTGGGIDFVRAISEEKYGISKANVIGTAMQTRFELRDQRPVLLRLPQFVKPINDGDGKSVNIERYIGRRPILAFGNSDGDIEMLRFAESDKRPWLSLLLHHDDARREYAYDKGTEKALELAKERNWAIVSMRRDFKSIFEFSE